MMIRRKVAFISFIADMYRHYLLRGLGNRKCRSHYKGNRVNVKFGGPMKTVAYTTPTSQKKKKK